jgi:hypothetical protein
LRVPINALDKFAAERPHPTQTGRFVLLGAGDEG